MFCVTPVIAQIYNAYQGQCFTWSYSDAFSVPPTALEKSTILSKSAERSFLECCMKCNMSSGCIGVAFDGEECMSISRENGLRSAEVSEEDHRSVRVMLFENMPRYQVSFN